LNNTRLRGLYVITDRDLFQSLGKHITEPVAQAIEGGARIVQYRNKLSSTASRRQEALALRDLCRQHNTLLIINDDATLARDIDADGVHIGQADTPLADARKILGDEKIIGVTCNNKIELAQVAQAGGADYVAFGRFFPSRTKPVAPPATIDVLSMAREELSIPIAAIGGITTANAQMLINHGADMLAVSYSVFGAGDIVMAARQLSMLFDS